MPPEVVANALDLLSELSLKLYEAGDALLRLADGNSLSEITLIVAGASIDEIGAGDNGVISALRFSVSPNF